MEEAEKYIKRFNQYKEDKKKADQASSRLSLWRLLVFLGGSALTLLTYFYLGLFPGVLVLLISGAIFLYFISKHQKVIDEGNRFKNLMEINQRSLARMEGTWTEFPQKGEAYVDPNHPYTGDLDIFGHGSLFQWINMANTHYGIEHVRRLMENPPREMGEVKNRQKAIGELTDKIDFCQALQEKGLNVKEFSQDPRDLLAYSENSPVLFLRKWISVLFYFLPVVTLGSGVLCFFDPKVSLYLPLTLVILQALINLLGFSSAMQVLNTISGYKEKVEVYKKLFSLTEKEKFAGEYLKSLKGKLYFKNKSASSQLQALENILNAADLKYNPLFYFVFNLMFFWNFHCVIALERWKENSGTSLRSWLHAIGELEALASLAGVGQMNPQWVMPEMKEAGPSITAKSFGHPLITENKRVYNSLILDNQITVITGSNMSGKTTLLRSVGINLVLAYAGAPVCAEEFSCSFMDIYTSMRLKDDLNSGISTFYAELLRIKTIIERSKETKPMIFLIDEVFRGTNSNDRVIGARSVIQNLNQPWILGMISTHDFELCELEKNSGGRIRNYHFTERYEGKEILFDYKLREGRCHTTNARQLMKMVGIEMFDLGEK